MEREEYKAQNEKRDAHLNKVIAARSKIVDIRHFWRYRPQWWKIPSDRIAAAIATFTLLLGIISYCQLKIINRQLDDSELQEAASVVFRNFSVSGFPTNVIIEYDILNVGRTRANSVNIDGPGYVWVNADETLTPKQNELFVLKQAKPPYGFGGRPRPNDLGITIDPSDPPRHIVVKLGSVIPKPIPQIIIKNPKFRFPTEADLISGHTISFFYLHAVYYDVFGHIWHVTGCIESGGNATFEPCEGQQNNHSQDNQKNF